MKPSLTQKRNAIGSQDYVACNITAFTKTWQVIKFWKTFGGQDTWIFGTAEDLLRHLTKQFRRLTSI